MKKQIFLCIILIINGLLIADTNPLDEVGNLFWGMSADTVSTRFEASVVDFNELAIVCNGEYRQHPAYVTYIFHDDKLSMITYNLLIESADSLLTAYEEIHMYLTDSYGKPIENQEIGSEIAKEKLINEISNGQRQLSSFWVVGDTRLVLSLKKSRLSEYPVSIVVLYSHNRQ